MALIFSQVTLRTKECEQHFFVCGVPKDATALDPYTAYQSFIEQICKNVVISVHADTYRYGEGTEFEATPAEVAYFSMRHNSDPSFLSRYPKISESDFEINYCPGELFFPELWKEE